MPSIKELERKSQFYMKKKEYLKAFDCLEEAIQKLDEALAITNENYKQQVLIQKRFELLVFAESITQLMSNDQLQKRTSNLQQNIQSLLSKHKYDQPEPEETAEKGKSVCNGKVNVIRNTGITWANIAGLESTKQVLEEAISWPLIYPDEMDVLGTLMKGLLLYGPPGCGKTLLAKAAAGSLNISLIIVTPSELLDKYLGETEKQLSAIFDCAREVSPTIILFDEIDKLLPMPGSSHSSDAMRRLEGEMLSTLDGLENNSGIIVLFTTNEPENINPALIRAGRIDRHILVPPPDLEAREAIFHSQLKEIPLDTITTRFMAEITKSTIKGSYSGADIAQIASEFKKMLFRVWVDNKEVLPKTKGDSISLNQRTPMSVEIVKKVLKQYIPGLKPNLLEKYEEWQRMNE
ncbi:MAG: ATP-binding protein [Candidatus Hodarchaeales archaeon]|jgi:SpoVK/Ycf46/Vps4 family AAA+-type ATPase